MLLRQAYLSVTKAFALLRLPPISDQAEDAEILALRHQITVLEGQLGRTRPRFSPADRAFLAALLHRLAPNALRRVSAAGAPGNGAALASGPARPPPGPGPSAQVVHGPCARSGSWCCAWHGRNPPGATAGSAFWVPPRTRPRRGSPGPRRTRRAWTTTSSAAIRRGTGRHTVHDRFGLPGDHS